MPFSIGSAELFSDSEIRVDEIVAKLELLIAKLEVFFRQTVCDKRDTYIHTF